MIGFSRPGIAARRVRILFAVMAHGSLLDAVAVSAQPTQRSAPTTPAPPIAVPVEPAPPPRENPGLLNELGKLWDNSTSLLPGLTTSPSPSAPPAAPEATAPDPADPAARSLPAPPPAATTPPPAKQVAPIAPTAPPAVQAEPPASRSVPSMVAGRATCPLSANGAPDCKAAAINLCVGKGFTTGSSLAIDASEKCSAKRLIPGRQHQADDCKSESFVTRALCQ